MSNMTTYTPNLNLRIDSDLTASAKANLNKIDALGAIWRFNSSGDLEIISTGDIYILPNSGTGDCFVQGDLLPFTDDTYDVGSAALRWRDLHLSRNAVVEGTLDVTGAATFGGGLTITGALAGSSLTLSGDLLVGGNIAVTGTVDGRDVAADGLALDAHIAATSLAHGLSGNFVGDVDTQTLTSKTLDADSNTLTNIADSSIKAGAAIARSKLAAGTPGYVIINHQTTGAFSEEVFLSKVRGGTGADMSAVTFPTTGTIISSDSTVTLTNKSISGLSNTITNIPYSALSLTAKIVNADVATAAGITGDKIHPDFGAQNVSTSGDFRLKNGLEYVGFQAPALAASQVWVLPPADGTAGQVLFTDGSGSLGWSSVTTTALVDRHIEVGDPTNIRVQVNTTTLGDIKADSVSGLTIKAGAVVNANVNAAAAIAYSKLNLTGSIVNADVKTSAAIAMSKLATLTANKAIVSNGSGALSASTVTATELGYLSGVTSAIQTQINALKHTYVLTVGAGGEYATIAAAQAAAVLLSPSASQRIRIQLLPEIFTETIIGIDYVDYYGSGAQSSQVSKIDCSASDSHVKDIGVLFTPTADGQVGFTLGSGFGTDVVVFITANADWSFTGIKLAGAAARSAILTCASFIVDTGVTTKDYVGIELDGSAFAISLNCAVEIHSSASGSGTHTGFLLTNSAELAVSNPRIYADHDVGFIGECRLLSTTGTPTPCQVASPFIRAQGNNNSGRVTAFHCDSGGAGAIVNVNFPSVDVQGYGTYYGADTAAGDEQDIRNIAANQAAAVTGAGSLLASPYDELKTGFVAWRDSGAYWSRTTNQFTLLRGGTGYIRGVSTRWPGSQVVTLTSDTSNYIYVDFDGVLSVTTTKSADLYTNNVVLFTVLYTSTGDVATVVKENHPYAFGTAVSNYAHSIFGTLIATTGANIGILGAASNRQVNLSGDSVLSDHGLDTDIPNSSASPLSIQYWYRDATDSFKWKRHSTATTVPLIYGNGTGAPVALTGPLTDHTVFRLYVTKDSLNSTAPQYIAVVNEAAYATAGTAQTAVVAGSITSASGTLAELGLAQLGYVGIEAGGTIFGVSIQKSQIGTTISVSGTTATTAGAVSTDTSAFDGILSGTDTSVQSALDTLDEHSAHKGSVATAATTGYFRIGPDNVAGSWRIGVSGGNLIIEKFNGTTWDLKQEIV